MLNGLIDIDTLIESQNKKNFELIQSLSLKSFFTNLHSTYIAGNFIPAVFSLRSVTVSSSSSKDFTDFVKESVVFGEERLYELL